MLHLSMFTESIFESSRRLRHFRACFPFGAFSSVPPKPCAARLSGAPSTTRVSS